MTFNFNTNARALSFDYAATVNKAKYSGLYSLHNFCTEAKLFGKYLSFTPLCQEASLLILDNWFQSATGVIATFTCFSGLTNGRLIAGLYSWTAEVGANNGLLLKSWRNTATTASPVWIRQPYLLSSAVPLTSNLLIVANKFTAVPGTAITNVTWGFNIVPEESSFGYSRNGGKVTFAEIPFLVITPA